MIEVVPPSERESGFYSRYFVVPKKDGGLRPILDLSGRDGVSPRPAVYAPPPDMAENTGAEKGMENGPCPHCGHSQVLERAETMAEPRPVPARRPDGFGHAAESGQDGRIDDGLGSSL